MNIAVCVKSVPDPEYYERITLDPVTKRLVHDGIPAVINDTDRHAIEAALRLKEAAGGEITVVSMGPPADGEWIRKGAPAHPLRDRCDGKSQRNSLR